MDQDWNTVTIGKKRATSGKASVAAAKREGGSVETSRKFGGGENIQHGGPSNARKLENEDEDFSHKKLGANFRVALQQARGAKKWTQKQLGQAINEKASVINQYEQGKVVPNVQIIVKMERALGARLPRPKKSNKA